MNNEVQLTDHILDLISRDILCNDTFLPSYSVSSGYLLMF